MKIKTLLEFNENTQQFHYNSIVKGKPISQPNSNGYKTLLFCEDDEEATLYADYLDLFIRCGKKLTFNEASIKLKSLFNHKF